MIAATPMKYALVATHCGAAEDSACDHCNEGNLSSAGDKGCCHNGHAAVTFVFNGS